VCPSYALTNPWILRGERSLALVIGALFVGSILWRMLFMGQMPNKLGSGGIEFSEVVEVTKEGLADLERSVETLKGETADLKKLLSRTTARSLHSFQEVYKRLDAVDKGNPPPE
jgi:malate/lactate dehydrogenase